MRFCSMRLIGMAILGFISLGLTPIPGVADDFVSAPVTGAAVVTTGRFTNIFFFRNPSQQTWEQNLAAAHAKDASVDLSETRAAINNFVRTLTQSTYFNRLSQYNAGIAGTSGPINPPIFLGEQETSQSCVDTALSTVHPNPSGLTVVGFDALRGLVACQNSQGKNPSDQVNIVLSPEFDASQIFQSVGDCTVNKASAYHASFPGIPNFTVIMTAHNCNKNLSFVAESISHEMVETISDPAGFGYIHETQPARFAPDPTKGFSDDWSAEFNKGELADICEKAGLKNPQNDPNIWAINLFGLPVARYWSNMDNECEPQPGLMLAPQAPVPTQLVNRIQFDILTGGDDLRGDSTATATVAVGGKPLTFELKAQSDHSWDLNTEHVKTFALPGNVSLNSLGEVNVALQSHNSGTETDDNWNVQTVGVTPMLVVPDTDPSLPFVVRYTTCFARVSGNPFVRLTGSTPSATISNFAGCATKPPATTQVNQLSLVVQTGGDDLRADSTATLTVMVQGQPRQFDLKTGREGGWVPNSTHDKTFQLGGLDPESAIGPMTIAMQSHPNFPETGDNWNIQGITATISDSGQSGSCFTSVSGDPFARLTGATPSVTIQPRQGC
jgi:hypothetical protein